MNKIVDGITVPVDVEEQSYHQEREAEHIRMAPARKWEALKRRRDARFEEVGWITSRHRRERDLLITGHSQASDTTLTEAEYIELLIYEDALCRFNEPKDDEGVPLADPDTVKLPARPTFLKRQSRP